MRLRHLLATFLATAGWSLAAAHGPDPAAGGDPARHAHPAAQPVAATTAIEIALPDPALLTSRGTRLHFARDVVGDHVVVVGLIYTSCTTVCPVVSALMADLRDQFAASGERRVRLVSLSIDPVRDTPARLHRFAARYGGDGDADWLWLTGASTDVDTLLRAFGTYTPNFEDHPSVVLVGDGASGRWTRHYGFPDPAALRAQAERFLAARNEPGHLAANPHD